MDRGVCCTSLQKTPPKVGVFDKDLSCTALILAAAFRVSQQFGCLSVMFRFRVRQVGTGGELGKIVQAPSQHHGKDFFEGIRGGIFQSLNEMME